MPSLDFELDAALRGRPEEGDDGRRVRAFVVAVRSAYAEAPDEATASLHLAAIASAAAEHAHDAPAQRPATARRRRAVLPSVLRAGGLAAGAAVVLTVGSAGLATAGVELPEPAKAPFDAVGIELPNQASDTAKDAVEGVRPGAGRSEERSHGRRGAQMRSERAQGRRKRGGDDAEERGERRSDTRSHGRQGAQMRSGHVRDGQAPAQGTREQNRSDDAPGRTGTRGERRSGDDTPAARRDRGGARRRSPVTPGPTAQPVAPETDPVEPTTTTDGATTTEPTTTSP